MVAQLGYCYSTNRSSTRPFDMLITSFNARLRQKFDAIDGKPHQNWRGVEWWDDSWDQLWATDEVDAKTGQSQHANTSTDPGERQSDPDIHDFASNTHPDPTQTTPQKPSRVPQTSIVYLTGDSPNVLDTLTPGETYILGGIVDHNRYKHLCLDRAERAGVRHAQLPIAEHMPALRTRKVLTVNQVSSHRFLPRAQSLGFLVSSSVFTLASADMCDTRSALRSSCRCIVYWSITPRLSHGPLRSMLSCRNVNSSMAVRTNPSSASRMMIHSWTTRAHH